MATIELREKAGSYQLDDDPLPTKITERKRRPRGSSQPGKLDTRTVASIVKAAKPGYTADGGNLFLQISQYGTPNWVFRFRTDGRLREMGLGALHTIRLKEAREEAERLRKHLQAYRQGKTDVDPLTEKQAKLAARRVEKARAMTFRECAKAYIGAHQAGWKNPKHAAQWPTTLKSYVFPVFGDLPVADIDVGLVMKVLEPLWAAKPETASRVRGRIESVLDWAAARGHRTGENPARWRGHLDKLLPAPSKAMRAVRTTKGRGEHHAALPYAAVGEFIADLRSREGLAARGLEFAILTAARTGEVLGMNWSEIDFQARTWTVPGERMKAGKEHRVPLSGPALALLQALPKGGPDDRPFELSNMALLMTLRRMKRGDLTAHGFRSTFSDWAAEMTAFPSEVREMALAHAVGDKVEAAYRRGDLFEKRRQLAEAWARFCTQPLPKDDNVRPLRQPALVG